MAKRKFLITNATLSATTAGEILPSDVESLPVGFFLVSSLNVDPFTYLGFGTWTGHGSAVWKFGSTNLTVYAWQRTA